jgi:hypothetical protein
VNFPIMLDMPGCGPYNMVIDVPDFEAAVYEMKRLVEDVCNRKAIECVNTSIDKTWVSGECLGVTYSKYIDIDKEFRQLVKNNQKIEQEAKKLIDMEVVKHDIVYAANMLRSLYKEDDTSWTRNEVLVWLYYSLNKHFGDPLPEEITKAKSELKGQVAEENNPNA